MKMQKWIVFLGGLMLFSGCCNVDTGQYLGLYLFSPTATDWLDIPVSTPNRLFVSSNGSEESFVYSPVEYFNQPNTTNCLETKCGTVCDNFDYATATTILSSTVGANKVVLLLSKDFDLHSTDEPATQIGELLQLQLNGSLTTTLYHLPDTLLTQSVTLSGRSFSQVFSYELPLSQIQPGKPSAVYFNKSLGIVGFRIGEDEIWRLK